MVIALAMGCARQLSSQAATVITGTVTSAVTGEALANVTVRVVKGRGTAVTTGDGVYRLALDVVPSEVRATAIGFAPASRLVSSTHAGSTVVAFALQPSAVPLDEVVSVGTRALERTVTRSPAPVDVVPAQLLENTGMPETWQQLQRTVPSVNVPHIPVADNHMRPVVLRGLAPHHALVLVNGKRRHPASVLLSGPSVPNTALTDLSAIPVNAIDRIEVLRDGASAEYGSDAIGGVVNVILKSGARRDFHASIGGVYSSEGGRDLRDGELFNTGVTLGFTSPSGAHVTFSGEVLDRRGTNRAYPDPRRQYFSGNPLNGAPPRISSHLGNGTLHALTLFLTAAAPVTGGTEAYAFGGVADRYGVTRDAFFRRPLDPRTVRTIHPDGFLPRIGSRIRDLSLVMGIRGSPRGWRWDLSSAWGGNGNAYQVHNSNNVSLGAASPTGFYAGRVAAQQWTSNLDVSRDLRLGSLPLTLSGGAEVRVDTYQIRQGEPDSWRDGEVAIVDGPQAGQRAPVGAQGMFGFRPIDEVSARRSNSAFYLEGEGRALDRLLLQLAGRTERYSDFGSTSDGKVAARLQLLRAVAVRGSLSSGFRAPALTQQYYSNTRTLFQLVDGVNRVVTTRTFPVMAPEAQLMGAVPLRPEQSSNASAGLVLQLPRMPLITADVYRITIKDRLGLAGSVTDTSMIRLFEENGMTGIGGGNYFANSHDTRTRGVDLVATHAFLFDRTHALRILLGYNHTRTVLTRVAPPPPQLARFGPAFSGRAARGVLENGQPRQTIALTLLYTARSLGVNLHNQRAGPTAQLDQANPDADQILRPKWITDLRISYQLRRRLQVAASAANLFDVYPDEWIDFKEGLNARGVSMQGIFRYPGGLSPFGMNGRTLYLRLAYR